MLTIQIFEPAQVRKQHEMVKDTYIFPKIFNDIESEGKG